MKIRTVDNNVGVRLYNQNADEGFATVSLELEPHDRVSIALPKGWTAKHVSTSDFGEEIWGFEPVAADG